MTSDPSTPCPNLNHRRSNAPVRFCSQCGGTVNRAHPIAKCPEDRHTAARRQQFTFCAYCGVRLIAGRTSNESSRFNGAADGGDRWRY